MYCTQCGIQMNDADRFCAQCGKASGAAPSSGFSASTSSTQQSQYYAATPRVYRPLTRSRDGWLGGVCAGLARYWDMDPALVRILFVGLALCPLLPAIIPYIVCWVIMPMEPLPDPIVTAPPAPPAQGSPLTAV